MTFNQWAEQVGLTGGEEREDGMRIVEMHGLTDENREQLRHLDDFFLNVEFNGLIFMCPKPRGGYTSHVDPGDENPQIPPV